MKISINAFLLLTALFFVGCDGNKSKQDTVEQNTSGQTVSQTKDGKTIYEGQCKSCHGIDGKMKALGKSNPVAGSNTVDADLKGYKAGTLNKHGMGSVMKGNASRLSEADIKAVAEYIASLK